MDKRVVLWHCKGRFSGLRQILGRVSELKEKLGERALPEFVDGVAFRDHVGTASLHRVRQRYVEYKENMPPSQETFTPHAAQV